MLRRPQNGTPRNDKSKDFIFSELFACAKCGFSLSEIEPRLFSFNSPFGACPECQGLGSKLEIDPNLVMPNPRLTLAEGAIRPWANASHRVGRQGYYSWILSKLADQAGFSLNAPVGKLPKEVINVILYGAKEYKFEGVINNLERRWKETESEFARAEIEKYMLVRKCPLCRGGRLKQEALAIKLDNHNIVEVSAMSVGDLKNYFQNLKLSKNREEIARSIIKEILKRFNGKVPDKKEELMSIKGIGPKTANIVLNFAFNQLVLPIDTHCHRIPNRLGWIKTKTPEQTEKELEKILPKKYWKEFNAIFVLFGKEICQPVSPKCSICLINQYCKKVGVNKSR